MIHILRRESLNLVRVISNPLFIYIAVIGNGFMLAVAVLFYNLEFNVNPHIHSFFDCIWWAVSTVTSVGYGDIVPVTVAGKIAGIILMYVGTLLYVLFTGLLATFWIRGSMESEIEPIGREVRMEEHELARLDQTLQRIETRIHTIESHLKRDNS